MSCNLLNLYQLFLLNCLLNSQSILNLFLSRVDIVLYKGTDVLFVHFDPKGNKPVKKFLLNGLAALTMTSMAAVVVAPAANAVFTAATVSDAGVLRRGQDHFFEVSVKDDPLQRVRVQCTTFHELDGVEVYVGDTAVEPSINYGFEEFTLTFAEPVPADETIRIVRKNSQVRGSINAGIDVPYRVFGNYPNLGAEVPLGTAVIRTPGGGTR